MLNNACRRVLNNLTAEQIGVVALLGLVLLRKQIPKGLPLLYHIRQPLIQLRNDTTLLPLRYLRLVLEAQLHLLNEPVKFLVDRLEFDCWHLRLIVLQRSQIVGVAL